MRAWLRLIPAVLISLFLLLTCVHMFSHWL
jgi:hypothetical protein